MYHGHGSSRSLWRSRACLGSVTRLRVRQDWDHVLAQPWTGGVTLATSQNSQNRFLTVKWGRERTLQGWLLSLLSEIILLSTVLVICCYATHPPRNQ